MISAKTYYPPKRVVLLPANRFDASRQVSEDRIITPFTIFQIQITKAIGPNKAANRAAGQPGMNRGMYNHEKTWQSPRSKTT